MPRTTRHLALAAAALAAACGGGEKKPSAAESAQAVAPPAAAGATATPAAGGKVIVVQMITDGTGNFYKPSEVAANPGDVVRFTLGIGVHSVHFLPDSNPGVTGLPPASDLLQLPGQTYDLAVSLKPGRYYFQCDPHAPLGMRGHLTVAKKG
jgi:plastocyanin